MRSLHVRDRQIDRPLLLLLRTFVDIITLRQGPDSVPRSWLVFALSLVLMALSSYAAAVMIDIDTDRRSNMVMFSAYGLGILFYAAVILTAGRTERMLQSITSIIGCGSIITVFVVAAFVLFDSLFGAEVAATVATLILFWSVPVEGHIIARAIGQHWFFGIVIAMAAFIGQYGLQSSFAPAQ